LGNLDSYFASRGSAGLVPALQGAANDFNSVSRYLAILSFLAAVTASCWAQSWDVAAAFKEGWPSKSNSYGVWSYGYSSGFTAPVTLYDRAEQNGVNGPNAQFWFSSAVDIANSPSAEFNNGPAYDEGNIHLSGKRVRARDRE
jgi:hypothetical protein